MRDNIFGPLAWEAEIRNFKQKKLKYQDACVCSIKVYKTTRSSNQTNTCVEKAARHYYNKIYPGRFLIDVEPLDSHTFDRHSEDPEDNNIYYHVNFQAKLGTCNSQPSLFFCWTTRERWTQKSKHLHWAKPVRWPWKLWLLYGPNSSSQQFCWLYSS